ncbi:MAG: electron transfer flavoprotein subunit beta/FixA family protein, partial [Spirochaetaceae bacterium]|nr:electron transfer flavoprotein subunit beta/FixA family protein [Spirochaetaceae bacterium]
MNIVVCLKQVPDTAEVKIDPVSGTLIREGIPSIINPDDKSGLEAALILRDSAGGVVTVLSMGPPQADLALREALAMGADKAILLSDRRFGGADTWATSCTLAAALRKLDWDLVICGRQAIDGDTAQVGPEIAEHLGIPQVSYVSEIKLDDCVRASSEVEAGAKGQALIVKRSFENGYQRIRVKLPCLLTTMKDMN